MTKKLLISTLALTFILPVQAFANEVGSTSQTEESLVEAGLTPDDFLYSADKVGESIELKFAENGVEEASLLEEMAEERVAEVVEMVEEGNTELVAPTLEEYQETIKELSTELNTAIENGQDVTEVIESINETQETEEELVEEAVEVLPESEQETITEAIEETEKKLEETTETVELAENEEEIESDSLKKQVATELLVAKVGVEALKKSQENKLNERQILAVQSLADKSGKSFNEVFTLFNENDKGIGTTAQALGLKPNEVMKYINHDFKETKNQIQKQVKETKKSAPAVQKDIVEKTNIIDSETEAIKQSVQKKYESKPQQSKQPEVKESSKLQVEKSKGKTEEKKEKHQPQINVNEKKVENQPVTKPEKKQETKPEKQKEVKPEQKEVNPEQKEVKPAIQKVTVPTEMTVPKTENHKVEPTLQPSKEKERENNGVENNNGKGNGQEKGKGHNK